MEIRILYLKREVRGLKDFGFGVWIIKRKRKRKRKWKCE